jgi:adenylate cyclase, class 2
MQNAPIEYEVKFFPIDIDATREKLANAGATIKTEERMMRRCVFSSDKNPSMICTYVRVRDEGNKTTMSAKQHAPDGKIESQKEYEIIVDSFETASDILLSAGLQQTGYQENKRETWQMPDGTVVELETWPMLPNYLEIEGASSEAVKNTADILGFDWSEHIVKSNDYLYSMHHNIERSVVFERFSRLTFDDEKA